jgi:hypothetical protein
MVPRGDATPCAHDRLFVKLGQSLLLLFAIVYEQWYHRCVIQAFIARGEINPCAQVWSVDGSVADGFQVLGLCDDLFRHALSHAMGPCFYCSPPRVFVHIMKYRRSTFDEGRESVLIQAKSGHWSSSLQ